MPKGAGTYGKKKGRPPKRFKTSITSKPPKKKKPKQLRARDAKPAPVSRKDKTLAGMEAKYQKREKKKRTVLSATRKKTAGVLGGHGKGKDKVYPSLTDAPSKAVKAAAAFVPGAIALGGAARGLENIILGGVSALTKLPRPSKKWRGKQSHKRANVRKINREIKQAGRR